MTKNQERALLFVLAVAVVVIASLTADPIKKQAERRQHLEELHDIIKTTYHL